MKRVFGRPQRVADDLIGDHIGEAVAAKEQNLFRCKRRLDDDVGVYGKRKRRAAQRLSDGMRPAETGVVVLAFGHVVVAELRQLASADQVATAIADVECDQLVGFQNGSTRVVPIPSASSCSCMSLNKC